MTDAFFRAGVGAVVRDSTGGILVLKRKNATDGAWQLPQGGILVGESPVDALHRELNEETGLRRDDIEVVKTLEDWLVYELPVNYRNSKVGWGQVQRWFLCRLLGPNSAIRPDQIELTEADWVNAPELLKRATSFRVPVYRRLIQEFDL